MDINEQMAKVREGLTDDYKENVAYLEKAATQYINKNDDFSNQMLVEISKLMYDIMPEEKKRVLGDKLYIDDERLDEVYAKAYKLTLDKKPEESFKLTEKLYNKILAAYRETEDAKYMAFRNPLENQIYLHIYAAPTKKLKKPPFDLSKFIFLHAYNLVDLGKPTEAVDVLNNAIRFNPVNPDLYFELAECYKLLNDDKSLLSVIHEISQIAVTPYALSRCYTDMGYYCVDIKDYDSAVCFYYESLIYANHPTVEYELQNIRSITGKKVVPPSRKEVLAAFEKYHLINGANPEVTGVAAALAQDAMQKNEKELARFYLLTLWGVTRDKDVEKIINESYGGIPEELQEGSFVNLKKAPEVK